MKATIWHNPNCGTSRKTLAILTETAGVEVAVVPYLEAGWDRAELARLIADAGQTPASALRRRGTDAVERGLPDADADTILDAMVAEPVLVERPFVRTDRGTRLCRPQDVVREIL